MSVPDSPSAEIFPPTLREVLLRPRWLGMLAFCLLVAGVFAWLGQWQLGRALDVIPVEHGQTEKVEPIRDVVQPGAYLNAPLVGQLAEAHGHFVPGDYIVVSPRMNDDVEGAWVTGQFRIDGDAPTSIAVAVGWAPTSQKAASVARALNAREQAPQTVTGRLIADEGPVVPPLDDPSAITTMSPAALLSRWHGIQDLDVYRPYMVSRTAPPGLTTIVARPPEAQGGLNWLNLFYAAEWAVFAGFAFYLWFRLAKDAWEKEVEDLAEASAPGEASEPRG